MSEYTEYTIANEVITATISTKGAELVSIKRNADGREYIWDGNPKFWKRHSPVLFPLIGKYKNNESIYNGTTYQMGQHGFARDTEFELVSKTDSEIWFSMTDNADTLRKYPFHFQLECGFQVEGSTVHVLWKVTNTDKQTIYFSLGAHPAFAAPADCNSIDGHASLAGCKLQFYKNGTPVSQVSYGLLSDDGLLMDGQHKLPLDNSGHALFTADLFDQDALVVENHQADQVSILNNDGNAFVTIAFDTPVFGVWSPVHANVPFLCIEPWFGRCDRESFSGTLADREWGNTLEAGKIFAKNYTITIA